MKSFIWAMMPIAALCVALTSCSTTCVSSLGAGANSDIVTGTLADLEVQPVKVTHVYSPARQVRRLGTYNCIGAAMDKALEASGCDVFVGCSRTVRRTGLRHRVKEVVITGYPARYVNFRPAGDGVLEDGLVLRWEDRGDRRR